MRKSTYWFIGVFLLLGAVFVIATVNVDNAYSYLVKQKQSDGSINNNVIDTSAALLALSKISYEPIDELNYTKKKQDAQGCFPAGACKIKDTAFALMALDAYGVDTSNITNYLFKSQSVAPLNGKWLLQIATDSVGTCKISYPDASGVIIEKSVDVNRGYFPSCANSTFLDINTCLQSGIVNAYAPVEFDVNCNALNEVKVISTIFRAGSTYYLVDEANTARATVTAENGCYGVTKGGSCDYESTLWANIALVEVGELPTSEFFLRQGADVNNALHQAALAIITTDNLYAKNVAQSQRNDGSWGGNIVNTALSVKALADTEFASQGSDAEKFFEKSQKPDGSIGNTFETSLALWAGLPTVSVSKTCFEGQQRSCSLQQGVCTNAIETCVNGTFTGCTEAVYKKINPKYETFETMCDGLDNDCDGSIDTGCECQANETTTCSGSLGVCANATNYCVNGTFAGCNYVNITGFQAVERACNDDLDNDCDGNADGEDDDCGSTSICNTDDTCDYLPEGESQANCPEDCDAACSNGLKDSYESGIDCGGPCAQTCEDNACEVNGICESDLGETAVNCGEDCTCGDNVCDDSEDEFTCAADCEGSNPGPKAQCGDGFCDDGEDSTCPEDCDAGSNPPPESSGGASWFWYVLIILLLLAVGGYFWYRKKSQGKKPAASASKPTTSGEKPTFESFMSKFKGPEKKTSTLTQYNPTSTSSKPAPKSDLEKELEKSVGEAKKLLDKK